MIILRFSALILANAVAYAFLRGWPEALPPILRACAAVLVLVAGIGIWARREKTDLQKVRTRRQPGWLDYVAIAGAVLAVESGFLWLLSATPRPLESVALRIEEKLRPEAAAARIPANDHGGSQTGNWLWNDQTRRPLPKRTNFRPGMRPEVFLRPENPADAPELLKAQAYVQAFALDVYEPGGWSASKREPRRLEADEAGWIDVGEGRETPGRAIPHEIFHAAEAGGQNVLTALHGVVSARLPELTRFSPGIHLLPETRSVSGYDYQVRSKPLRLEDLPRGSEVAAGRGGDARLLAVPASLRPRVAELTREAAAGENLATRLLGIRNHLRSTLEYSLETTNPKNLDPIENFLFEERRGHCEYFATAGALMVRSLGVPARVGYGWAGGTYYDTGNLIVFRANEAHAWTEVLLAGHGWVVLDPTPPSAIGGARPRVAGTDEKPPGMDSPTEEELAEEASGGGGGAARAALLLVMGFGIPSSLVLVFRGARNARDEHTWESPPAAGEAAPDYLLAWRRACALRGITLPGGATLLDQLERIDPRPEFGDELLAYHYGTRYEGKTPDRPLEKRLIRRIKAWEKSQTTISNPSR